MLTFMTIMKSVVKKGLAIFWSLLRDWIIRAVRKLLGNLADAAADAVRTSIQDGAETMKQYSSVLIKDGVSYVEKIAFKKIDRDSLPQDIAYKATMSRGEEVDITEDFANVLS